MNRRVRAVVRKELREFRRNRLVFGTMIVLPLVFLGIPLSNVLAIRAGTAPAAVKAAVDAAGLLFFLVPLILPTVIAGYAVVGEREQGTLEPVLTTPIRAKELLIGKALAAILPSSALAYLVYLIFLVAARAVAIPAVFHLVWQPAKVLAVVLFVPLLATFSIWVGLAISTRSSDVRVAQQLAGLAMLPMLGLVSLFSFGVVEPNVRVAVTGALILAILDLGSWRVVSALFDPERLLTRYGGP